MCDEIKFVYLKSHPLFSNLTDQQIKDATQMMKVKTVYRGEFFDYGAGPFSKLFYLSKEK